METYWENITKAEKDNIDRGLYMILPLRYRGSFQSVSIAETEEISKLVFDSSDFTELLSVKCRKENFVKRFSMNSKVQAVRENWNGEVSREWNQEISEAFRLDDLQLFTALLPAGNGRGRHTFPAGRRWQNRTQGRCAGCTGSAG